MTLIDEQIERHRRLNNITLCRIKFEPFAISQNTHSDREKFIFNYRVEMLCFEIIVGRQMKYE